jgi:hypothetical protein
MGQISEIKKMHNSVQYSYSVEEFDKHESCEDYDKQKMHKKSYCHRARRNEEGNPCTASVPRDRAPRHNPNHDTLDSKYTLSSICPSTTMNKEVRYNLNKYFNSDITENAAKQNLVSIIKKTKI